MVPDTTTNLKVEFYARTAGGINENLPITLKSDGTRPDGIYTDFKVHEFPIDPKNPSETIISILFWMMMEPNIFSVVKWGSENLIYLDIYDLFDQSHINSGTIDPSDRIDGLFLWNAGDPIFSTTKYDEFKQRFSECFEYGDIMHFLGFHNHELDRRFDNVIDYIMNIVLKYFRARGVLDEESELFELR